MISCGLGADLAPGKTLHDTVARRRVGVQVRAPVGPEFGSPAARRAMVVRPGSCLAPGGGPTKPPGGGWGISAGLVEAFKAADINKNGLVSTSELQGFRVLQDLRLGCVR